MKAIPRKQRAMVRKGIDHGLQAGTGRDVDLLHAIYAESVRNLGTPVFSRGYFRILRETFAEAMDVVTITDAGRPVAAVMNFYWRDEVLPYYGGGTEAARRCHANDFMYWSVMRHAADRGCRLFDFGRSKEGHGCLRVQEELGVPADRAAVFLQSGTGQTIPENNPLKSEIRLMIAAWQKLPLGLANRIGPFVVRGLG